MRHAYRCALALGIGVGIVSAAAAQNTLDPSAVTNPPRYPDRSAVESLQPQASRPQTSDVPSTLTLPGGTLVRVRLNERLSSDRNYAGDGFTASIEQPIVVQGWVVADRGQTAVGRVVAAHKSGRIQGVSGLSVELSELTLVDGQQVPIRTQLIQTSVGTTRGADVAAVGTTTGLGAVIGAAAGGGEGAAIGAAIGAAAGLAGILSTRGRATELYPEMLLTFRLEDPVTISTFHSVRAFRPVNRQDYAVNDRMFNLPRNFPIAEAYPPPVCCTPPYHPPYRFYRYYGFSPRIFIGTEIIIRGRR